MTTVIKSEHEDDCWKNYLLFVSKFMGKKTEKHKTNDNHKR